MLNYKEFVKRIESFLDKPFILDDSKEGVNCISLILEVYKGWYDFPEEFEGITLQNRAEMWIKQPKKSKEILGRFVISLGREVKKNYQRRGDILLFKGKEIPIFYAIHIGNGNMAMVFEEGFQIVPFAPFSKVFLGARRLVE